MALSSGGVGRGVDGEAAGSKAWGAGWDSNQRLPD
jgi:hypothetical protein